MMQDREAAMTDTSVLLGKIAALRERLDQAQGLAREADSAASDLADGARGDAARLRGLERRVASGGADALLLDASLRQLNEHTPGMTEPGPLPQQLTSRARRVLEQTHQLLGQLRSLADQLDALGPDSRLASHYRETGAMTETVLRVVQAFPDSASAQLRLCEGVEAILGLIVQRIALLIRLLACRRLENERLKTLMDLLSRLANGQTVAVQDFITMANEILAEVDVTPLRFPESTHGDPVRLIAEHSLTTAQVIGRIVRADPELRARPMEPVLAALVHDVGMLRVPTEIILKTGTLDDTERRATERHAIIGAELAAKLLPGGAWLSEAAGGHHERLDGTGYPGGLRDAHLTPLTRLLAVCDVYAALCSPRPYRPARETRTALADTLLLADQGGLDPREAERLLTLSFYPVGAAVELANGAIGVVVATHMAARDLNTPARPIVAVLTDALGRPLPTPQYIDLGAAEGPAIVRTLTAAERQESLGRSYPEAA
jgi:hypothetical protein